MPDKKKPTGAGPTELTEEDLTDVRGGSLVSRPTQTDKKIKTQEPSAAVLSQADTDTR